MGRFRSRGVEEAGRLSAGISEAAVLRVGQSYTPIACREHAAIDCCLIKIAAER